MRGRSITGGRGLVPAASAVSVLLVVAYLVAGGATYGPTAVADPCQPREWRAPDDLEESAQQFALSALDGAACDLHVSREELALALATENSRREFAADYGIDEARLEAAVRAGVVRAIDDAEQAGALPPLAASGLRAAAERLPIDQLMALINDASSLFTDAEGLLDRLGGQVP